MARRRRGSSKSGRPRKTGPRHPGGKLIQKVDPNGRVTQERAALGVTPFTDCDDPMAFAYARGWLTERQHKAGEAYAAAYRRSHAGTRSNGLQEAPDASARDMRTIGQMAPIEICAAFDRIMETTPGPGMSEQRRIDATAIYNRLSRSMTPAEQIQTFQCFCLRSWPQWAIWQAKGLAVPDGWETKRVLLIRGLDVIATLLTRRRTGLTSEIIGSPLRA